MITTANLFAEKGHKVTLLVLDHTAKTYYPVHAAVTIAHQPVNFGITEKGNFISRKLWLWRDTRKLRRLIKQWQPGYLICSEYPFAVAAILAGAKKYCRVYSWEHHHYGAQQLNTFWKALVRRTYKKLDAVVCLNRDEQQYYRAFNEKATVIPNFIFPPQIRKTNDTNEFELISVTRFNHIKGIDLLMQVAGVVLSQNPGLAWKVIGYGKQENAFLDFIQKENLTGRLVYQPANKTDISDDYSSSSIFIMTSRNECFPLVLLEAMSHGLPCIAFDCDTGPRHIIQNNETGILVKKENVQEMVTAITTLVNNRVLQKQMSENARKAVQSYFPEKVYEKWATLLRQKTN